MIRVNSRNFRHLPSPFGVTKGCGIGRPGAAQGLRRRAGRKAVDPAAYADMDLLPRSSFSIRRSGPGSAHRGTWFGEA